MSDFYYTAKVGWYNREVTPLPTAEFETPLGLMRLECRENWFVYGDIETPVVIHRVPYKINVEFRFNRHTEEWAVYDRSMRVRLLDKPDYHGHTWHSAGGYPTEAARKIIVQGLRELFETWAATHYELIDRASKTEVLQLIEKGFHWCDEQQERLEARRRMLERLRAECEEGGRISDIDRRHLNDMYSWRL